MFWRLSVLLCALLVITGYSTAVAHAAPQAGMPMRAGAGTHPIRVDFPFPVMPGWAEHSTTRAQVPPRQIRASTWIHDGDAASQAIAYRLVLEAAGYRVAPGQLAGNAELALTGTGMIAGRPYRFAVEFSRGPGGDQRVVLEFTPCTLEC